MNKKRKTIICIIVVILIILLFPIRMVLKDGGSVEYKAILYTITKYHKLSFETESGYTDGIGIKILGMEIYNNTKEVKTKNNNKKESRLSIVTSLEDEIQENTAWCGTFNLIWNDLKNDIAKQDIVFNPQLDTVKNLNKGTFTTKELSEDSYYKVYGHPSLELKKEIEKAIKKKFNETSDILDDFDWINGTPEDYFLYSMLKKEFHFPKVFTELPEGKFGVYENVKYFGIDNTTDEQVRKQVEVLYYNSNNDFAIKLITKENDEVIITKGNNEKTFGSIYKNIEEQSSKYNENKNILENEKVAIPNISFDLKEEIKEVENKPFFFSNGDSYRIEKALQTIKFDLDKKGGKIKSEAGMMVDETAIMPPKQPREFLVNDTFTIFLKEKDRNLPYFAAKISDISQVQEGVKSSIKETEYSKLAEMYIAMIEDILAKDQALQENIKFIDIDFTNFRSPLTEEELVDVREKSYFLPNFKTEEEKTNWHNLIESKPLTEDVKQEIMDYLKEKFHGKEIKQNTYEELKQQKLADDKKGIKDGFVLYIEKAPKIKENSAKVELVKYRGPLAANLNLYSMEYKDNNWNLKLVRETIS